MSYVVQDKNNTDITTVYTKFINKTVTCAQLSSEHFDADKLTIFNFNMSFTIGQPSRD